MDDFDDRFGADCQVKVINHHKWVNINKSVQGRGDQVMQAAGMRRCVMRLTLTPPFFSVAAAVDWLDRELPADCCWNVEAGRRQSSLHTRRDAARILLRFGVPSDPPAAEN